MRKIFLPICFFFSTCLFAQKKAPSRLNDINFSGEKIRTSSEEALYENIEKLKQDPALEHASWGLCVVSTKTAEVIAEYNSNVSLVPASTLKILTTGAALGILDTSFKYETKIEYDGLLDTITGILRGNLYIKGSGDPTLESEYFKSNQGIIGRWVQAIKQKGIRKIEGAVVADASVFEDEIIPSTWIWGDMGNYYGAGACGINYADNKYKILFKSGMKSGDPTSIIKTDPEIPGLKLTNYVITGGNDDNAFVYGAPYSYDRSVSGTIPEGKSNYEVEGSVPDPAWFCAYSLEKELKKNEIEVKLPCTTIRELNLSSGQTGLKNEMKNNGRKTIYQSNSPTLDSIVYYTNLKSNNLYAEHLLKTIAYKKTGFGTEESGIEQVKNYWSSKGIDIKGLHMTDGCGLSRANIVTTRQQAEILRIITKAPYYKAFYNSLPVAGESGSLASMCKGTCAENNLSAKSGYINRARGYVGYVVNKKGEQLAFSILANNYECSPNEMKKKLEKLMVLIAEL